ncbi:MAG: hypothetical protein U0354_01110 [Candidatus Sericytochromatia bacterium]
MEISFRLTGKIIILSNKQEIKFNKVTISIIKDDIELIPKSLNLYCLANIEQIKDLEKSFKLKSNSEEEVLIFSLKDKFLSEHLLEIANSKTVNQLMQIGDLDLLNLDNYEYTGLHLSK